MLETFDVVEITHGLLHIGKYIRFKSILDLDSIKNPDRECYSSVFLHSAEVEKWWSENSALADKKSYAGAVKPEFIHFDFDSEKDLFSALMDSQELVRDLLKNISSTKIPSGFTFPAIRGSMFI
jgi:hypothetical protein